MCRTALRLIVTILATFSTSTSFAAETPPAAPKKTYSADDPVVKLALKLRKSSVYCYATEEEDGAASPEDGHPRSASLGPLRPDENGRYSFANPPKNVRKILLNGAADERKLLSAEDIRAIARFFPNVEILILRDQGRRTGLFVGELDTFQYLKDLTVSLPMLSAKPSSGKPIEWTAERRAEVSRALFRAIPRLTRLERLNVNLSDLSDEDFRYLGKSRSLQDLAIIYGSREIEDPKLRVPPVHEFSASSLVDAVAEMKELRNLNTRGCRWVGPVNWDKLAALPHLETLNCSFSGLDDEQLQGIEKLAHLKSLDLSFTSITGKSLDYLGKLRSLETLNLQKTNVAGNILALAELPNLKEVDYPAEPFRKHALTPEELDFFVRTCKSRNTATVRDPEARPLWKINRLVPGGISRISLGRYDAYLTIEHVPDGVDPPKRPRCVRLRRPLVAADFERFEDLTSLTDVRIVSKGESLLTDKQIASFASLPKLVHLGLTLDKPVTAEILSHFANHPTIERLSVSDIRLDEEAARHIASIPNLRSLDLSRGSMQTAAWQPLARAKALREVKLQSVTVEGPPGARFRGIEQIPVLESLNVWPEGGNDAECRWIGQCRTLRELSLDGTFSAVGIERLTPMPNLEMLSLGGTIQIPEPNEQLRVLGRNPRLQQLTLRTKTPNRGHLDKHICCGPVAREIGIHMVGACTCGCMDVEPDNAMVVPANRFTIRDDRLVLDEGFSRALDSEATALSYNGRLRFLVPIRRKRLRIECASLPKRLGAIYFNACQVDRLELVGCNLSEFGVFGTSDVGQMHMIESENQTPSAPGKFASAGHTLYLAGVRELTVCSSAKMRYLAVMGSGRLRALRLDGEFPELQRLNLEGLPELRYLEAPYAGHAPKLRLTEYDRFFQEVSKLPSLRLLKLPGTAVGTNPVDSNLPAKLPPLHEIDLRKTRIDDEWLEQLAKIKTLRILRIGGCENLTAEGIAQFREARPEVEVVE